MNAIDVTCLLTSMGICVAYVCRGDALKLLTHKPEYLLFHAALFVAALFAGLDASHGVTDVRTVCALIASGTWLVISFPTWRNGVPAHVLRVPQSSTLEVHDEGARTDGHRLG